MIINRHEPLIIINDHHIYIYYTIYILIVHPQPLIIIYGHFPGGYYGHGAMKSWEERGYISQPLRAARQTLKKRGNGSG